MLNTKQITQVLIEGTEFSKNMALKLGEVILLHNSLEVNIYLTSLVANFPQQTNGAEIDVFQQLFISNNNGKDWIKTGVFLLYTDFENYPKFRSLYSSTSLSKLSAYQLKSESIESESLLLAQT